MAWTDNVPLAANQISADLTAMNGDLAYLKLRSDDYDVAHNTSGGHNSNFLNVLNTTGALTAAYDGAYAGATSANTTVSLPTLAAAGTGKLYTINCWAVSSTYYVRVTPSGSEQIYYTNGATTVGLGAGVAYYFPMTGRLVLYNTGSEWIILQELFNSLQDNADHGTGAATSETTLASVTIPANSLRSGDIVRIKAAAVANPAAAGNLTFQLLFGSAVLFTTGVDSTNVHDQFVEAEVMITGSSAQRAVSRGLTYDLMYTPVNGSIVDYVDGTEAVSGAITIATKGTTSNSGDEITNKILTVQLIR